MKKFLLFIFIICVLISIAVARAPASLIPHALSEIEARGLMQPEAPKIYLTDTSGTIWEGKAGNAVLELNGGKIDLGVMTWSLDFFSLLKREPVLQVLATAPEQRVTAKIKANEQGIVTVNDIEGRLPIDIFEPWVPMLVKGEMAFVLDHLVFTSQELLAIDGVLNLEYVDWLGGDFPMPLGSYMAEISKPQTDVLVVLNDFSATLGIDGQVSINPAGVYQFNAMLEPREGLAPEVYESLRWFGKRQPNGDVLIKSRGKF